MAIDTRCGSCWSSWPCSPLSELETDWTGPRTIHAAELKSAATAQNINTASDLEVLENLSFYQSPSLTRMQVRIAEALHLTLFADSDGSLGHSGAIGFTEPPDPASGSPEQ